MAKNWIQKAIKKPGALRKSLGVKAGKKIPASKLNKAAKAKKQRRQSIILNLYIGTFILQKFNLRKTYC